MARTLADIREYYREITAVDIVTVAREILSGRVTIDGPRELSCDCPYHASVNKQSLKIWADKQGWYCHGCGVGGDVLHLVEFVSFRGKPTVHRSGVMPESHRQARDWLAQRAGLPPLNMVSVSDQERDEYERKRHEEQRTRQALRALATLYWEALVAPAQSEVLEWSKGRWPISEPTIERLKIGYVTPDKWVDRSGSERDCAQYELMGTDPRGVLGDLHVLGAPFTKAELLATGAFCEDQHSESLRSNMQGRIFFPYWARGAVVYGIGRATPWTKGNGAEAKYKKLSVWGAQHEYVSRCINNSWMWGEDCLLSAPKQVYWTEGITDAISLDERGIPVVSPVTVKLRDDDWKRILARLTAAEVKTVYIVQDNEVSQAGLRGALDTAARLQAARIDARVIELPLGEAQEEARAELARLGIHVGVQQPAAAAAQLPLEKQARVKELLEQAKVDVASYLLGDGTKEDLESLARAALSPIELAIARLPERLEDAREEIEKLVAAMARLDDLSREPALKRLRARYGSSLSLKTLKDMVSAANRATQFERHAEAIEDDHDCRALVGNIIATHREVTAGHTAAAAAVYKWFVAHGGKFFRTRRGEPFLYWESNLYWLDSPERFKRRSFYSLLRAQTGLVVDTNIGGKTLVSALASMAHERGQMRETFSWVHTDVQGRRVWLSLANERNEIVRIDGDGVTVMPNGDNADAVILQTSEQVQPIEYVADVSAQELDALLHKLVARRLACAHDADRQLIVLWASLYGLLELAGMRPIMRAEGPQRSGKTTAAKLISTLIFGAPQHKSSTIAADYADASANPLVVLDNIEVEQYTPDLKQFLLLAAGGAIRQKRAAGTDSDTITEVSRCLLLTNGIEPIGGAHPELLSRSFVVAFEDAAKLRPVKGATNDDDVFSEVDAIAELQAARGKILSGLFGRWSRMLALMRDDGSGSGGGAHKRIQKLLSITMGPHGKERLNEYLGLMYLALVVDLQPEVREKWLEELHPGFRAAIIRLNATTDQIAQESTPIATALAGLFSAWRACERAANARSANHELSDRFRVEYPIEFDGTLQTKPVTARCLYLALTRYAAAQRFPWPFRSPMQLIKRIENDAETIAAAGFRFHKQTGAAHGNVLRWVIEQFGADVPSEQVPLRAPDGGVWGAPQSSAEERWP